MPSNPEPRQPFRSEGYDRAVVGPTHSQVLIVGGGPAGAALAQILVSRGARVTLVERQTDFGREFRGEGMAPGGIHVLQQMGLSDAVASLPQKHPQRLAVYRDRRLAFEIELQPDLFGESGPPFILSQPHLLEMLIEKASLHENFHFVRGGLVRHLVRENGRVTGVRATTHDGEQQLTADLVVGADGRASVVRSHGDFSVRRIGAPMDIVWCKLPWPACYGDSIPARVYLGGGHLLIALPAPDGLLQVAWVILKGTFGELRSHGVEEWVAQMAEHVSPDLAEHFRTHVDAISRPFLLDVRTDRVRGWAKPGVLLLGDAAHTMSPVGAQGINVALRDAVVAANHLVPVLRGNPTPEALDAAAAQVETERAPEIKQIQALAAMPPRLVMRPGRLAEAARALAFRMMSSPLARRLAARPTGVFLNGVVDVTLRV